ncbi:MAG: hypothetical protein A2Z14_17230 [Chloroflexi bacterium RBG_16_48_8]|nr:MAG: hypothetical protein A2Z14_17230 [Chloroflexi bacterium RBG_16_48_8]
MLGTEKVQMIDVIEETSLKILEQTTGVVVRYCLLRYVLKKAPDCPEVQQAKDNLKHSRCIQELEKEQWADGGWGAFHSRSTLLKQKIPSTEVGVERALALGLDASHPILQKASAYILDIMRGKIAFPDYYEKNDRWQTGMRLFLTSALSLISPDHPDLNSDRELWHEIARRTFQSGRYRQEDEIKAHNDLTGATIKDSYLVLSSRYQLNILGSIPGMLSEELEAALLQWLWEKPDGIGYLEIPLNQPPPTKPGPFDRWLTSLEMLSRLFPTWVRFARSSIEWLWKQRDEQGYWDFGSRPSSIAFMPLSDHWRERQNRLYDWTIRILILLRKFDEGSHLV